jgi:uncharacterized protein Yka (UPF0111/DUF47 family)
LGNRIGQSINPPAESYLLLQREMPLDQKMQLRDLVKHVDGIADQAEDMADSLAIYVIKRSL